MDVRTATALAAAAVILALYASQDGGGGDDDQSGSVFDRLPNIADLYYMTQDAMNNIDPQQAKDNLAAFLDTLRYAEGTLGEDGYRALFGWRPGNGRIFASYADHPRQLFPYTDLSGKTIQTSAAGAYQITRTTYDALQDRYPELRGRGFYPQAQDDMAVLLIAERGALQDVYAGRFASALNKVRKVWASLPNSNVNQPTRSFTKLAQVFNENGGVIV